MTAEGAKTKWCPFGQRNHKSIPDYHGCTLPTSPVSNRNYDDKPRTFCLAEGCMAWRWARDEFPKEPSNEGFCGLAGNPAL